MTNNGLAMYEPEQISSWEPLSPGRAGRDLLIWGAHGGAGTSTLAALLPGRDMGTLRTPADYRYPYSFSDRDTVVVACRCTTWSAIKASAAIRALTKAGGHVVVLAVVSDGWPEPDIATSWFRLLSAQVDTVIRMPFVPWLRLCNDAAPRHVQAHLPRSARAALARIRAVASSTTPLVPVLQSEGGRDDAATRDARPARR